jgi:hypothetical protein
LLQKKIENVYKNNMVIPNEHYENRNEFKIEEIERLRKGSENVLKGGLNKLPKYQRKSKFNELFDKKFGYLPAAPPSERTRKRRGRKARRTRKN